jgi:ABC-type Mn2+/Zn2+ transport system ATPase subunit
LYPPKAKAPFKNMKEPLITLQNLSVGYGTQSVLSDISLSIARENFTAILGANGSGKSTLLKTLLGILPVMKGDIRFATFDNIPPIFGYVPQTTQFDSLYLLTGFDVALMGVYGRIGPGQFIPKSERKFVHECLVATSATEFSKKQFSELSGGQKQRILIARALAAQPEVLVLDEPTAGVDTATTKSLLQFISQIHQKNKLTILLVTHDLSLVRKHAQSVIWLHEGKISSGTVGELLAPERMAELFEVGI